MREMKIFLVFILLLSLLLSVGFAKLRSQEDEDEDWEAAFDEDEDKLDSKVDYEPKASEKVDFPKKELKVNKGKEKASQSESSSTPSKKLPIQKAPEDVDEFDEDEFIGFDKKHSKKKRKETGKSKFEAVPLPPIEEIDSKESGFDGGFFGKKRSIWDFIPDFIYLIVLIAFGLNYYFGSSSNEAIATTWAREYRDVLEQNFSKVGEKAILTKESQTQFTVIATGRIHCIGMQCRLELQKRQDIFGKLMAYFDDKLNFDKLVIEVPMNDDCMEPFIFSVFRKKHEKILFKDMKDLKQVGAFLTTSSLPEEFSVYTDNEELVPMLLTDEVVSTIKKYSDLVHYIHFTDQNPWNPKYKKLLRFYFKLPGMKDMGRLMTLTKMVFFFIDHIAVLSFKPQAKEKALRLRAKAAEQQLKESHQQRQEAAQLRKQEKARLEKEKEKEGLLNLSPEAQKKREEKEAKRQIKKQMQQRVKVMHG